MERLVLLMDGADDSFESLDVFVATRGESAQRLSLIVLESLRDSGLKSDTDYLGRSLKAQLRQANRTGAKAAVILGDDELERGVAQVKWMDRDSQDEMPLDSLAAELSIALTSTDGQAGT
jgi:histidyl-tRNA synthetase